MSILQCMNANKNKISGLFHYLVLGLLIAGTAVSANLSPLMRPLPALSANDVAIIVNDADPLSVRIAEYYRLQRQVPESQIIRIRFATGMKMMKRTEFEQIKKAVDRQTPPHVQAFVLTWLQPFRVECMSITTAFAMGFDQAFCAKGCQQTRKNPYFASNSDKPYKSYKLRPVMVLAGNTFAEVKGLIDRGVASDYSQPNGTAYLLKTSDKARSSRAAYFPHVAKLFDGMWPVKYLEQDFIRNRSNVMFYFTGLRHVPHIQENIFLPGAVADHLTSTGGVLSGSKQMSIMEWIKNGATGTYGAVVEPCNYPDKFSHPGILMENYLRGSTLIEAYWKSVAQPGQGIFVGEPLAKPFAYRLRTVH